MCRLRNGGHFVSAPMCQHHAIWSKCEVTFLVKVWHGLHRMHSNKPSIISIFATWSILVQVMARCLIRHQTIILTNIVSSVRSCSIHQGAVHKKCSRCVSKLHLVTLYSWTTSIDFIHLRFSLPPWYFFRSRRWRCQGIRSPSIWPSSFH